MTEDIAKVLSFEIKKELAERYFGFRKLIEEDKEELAKELHFSSITVEHKIIQDLVRLYILLQDDGLIRKFLDLSGLGKKIFFDPYLLQSPTIRKKVFAGVKTRGLTQSGRFKNLVLDCYEMLVDHVETYREKYAELLESREIIEEEIKLFYQKNDIGSIMSFLRSIDSTGSPASGMDGGIQTDFSQSMEKKMKLHPPKAIEESMPVIPSLVPLSRIKSKLKQLADKASSLHEGGFHLP
ncbi:MAG: hypothetical protein U9R66_00070 [Thermodesulfobacteriota bacterium]|nr:hypothetical protein [Thermodesulfobacteriota bacterium]